MYNKRNKILLNQMHNSGFSYAILTLPENIFYMTGFWGHGILIINENQNLLMTSTLEKNKAEFLAKNCEILVIKNWNKIIDKIETICSKKKKFFDSNNFMLNNKLHDNVIVNSDIIYNMRRTKDEYELKLILNASQMIDKLYLLIENEVKIGMSERNIASLLLSEIISNGYDLVSTPLSTTPLIVASGPHSSFPHSDLSDRNIQEGDLLTVDIFIRSNGYVSDSTRTFGVGRIDKKLIHLYEIVQSAQNIGFNNVKENMSTKLIDKKVRTFIEEKKLGKYFIHGTGHGVGLDVHEPPIINPNSQDILKLNDVITIEPGIYFPNKFGIRIEDTILVSNPSKSLLNYTKELITIG